MTDGDDGRTLRRAFLGLGSNLGDRRRFLRDAIETLGAQVRQVSPVYETDPVGGPDQDRYLNVVGRTGDRPHPANSSRCATASRPVPAGCARSAGVRAPSTSTSS